MFNKKSLAVALVAGAFSLGAHADMITASTGLTLIEDFESFDGLVTAAPLSLSGLVTVAPSIPSTFGAFAVDLVDNGTWGAGNNFAGIGDLVQVQGSFAGSMTFSFAESISGVGALLNTYNDGSLPGSIMIEALGAGGSVLETYSFVVALNDPFATNAGLFRGIQRYTADIFGFRVTGDGFVVDNLSTVPLPAALPLLLAGLAGFAGIGRRRWLPAER
jgi:hypothetical protein